MGIKPNLLFQGGFLFTDKALYNQSIKHLRRIFSYLILAKKKQIDT